MGYMATYPYPTVTKKVEQEGRKRVYKKGLTLKIPKPENTKNKKIPNFEIKIPNFIKNTKFYKTLKLLTRPLCSCRVTQIVNLTYHLSELD